jgi:hypothetical protein
MVLFLRHCSPVPRLLYAPHRPPFSNLAIQPRPALFSPRTILGPLSFQSLTNCPPFATHWETLSFQSITNCKLCNSLVFKFVQNARWVGRSRGSTPASIYLFYFQSVAHSFALFCTHAKLNSFLFKRLRTLCQKHPGGGILFSEAPWRRGKHATTFFLPPVMTSRITSHRHPSHCAGRRTVPQWPARLGTNGPLLFWAPCRGPNDGKQARPLRCLREESGQGVRQVLDAVPG